MRNVILFCLISACSAYPVVRWPQGAGPTQALLPQADLQGPAATQLADPSLGGRAADLQTWASSVAP